MMASDLAVLVNDIFEIWQLILWKTQWIILLGKLAPFSSRKQHYLLVWFLLIIFIYLHFVLFCFCLDLLFVSWRIHLNWSFSLINFGSVHIELKFDSKFESAILNNIIEKMSSLCFNQTHAFHVITTIISPPSWSFLFTRDKDCSECAGEGLKIPFEGLNSVFHDAICLFYQSSAF